MLIVVSGGQGPQETVTEAEAMRRYLVSCGVAEDHIVKEERATSTLENLQFSDALLRERVQMRRFQVFGPHAAKVPVALIVCQNHHDVRSFHGRFTVPFFSLH